MNDNSPKDPADRLVEADRGISDSELKEFRMNLERSVHALEKTAYDSQRNVIRFFFGMIACQAIGYLLTASGLKPEGSGAVLAFLWSAASIGVLLGFLFSLIRYWTQHRPTLERARTDLQIAMFGELQREIEALNRRLERQQ